MIISRSTDGWHAEMRLTHFNHGGWLPRDRKTLIAGMLPIRAGQHRYSHIPNPWIDSMLRQHAHCQTV